MKKIAILFFYILIFQFAAKGQDKSDYKKSFTEGSFLVLESNYFHALRSFLEAYAIDSTNANINYKVGFCYLKTASEKGKALKYLEKAVANTSKKYSDLEPQEKSAPVNAYYFYGQALHFNYQFDEAIANYEKFKSFLSEKQEELLKDVNRQIEISNNAKILVAAPINVIITNMGDSINSNYPDYSPVVSADEETIIFTSRRPGSTGGDKTDNGSFYEDIYISYKKKDSTWSSPASISTNINTITHEASVGLSADAQTLLIYKDSNGGDIYYSTVNGNNWTAPQSLGPAINGPKEETSACLSPNGKTLFFVSNRKGGLGGRDIWQCVKLPNGDWSMPQNVGAPVNTPYDEETPFFHPSGNVLFFSSQGHQSIGGYDIFFSTKADNGSWNEPLNIGYPINTTDDDVCYVTSPDGKRGYYCSSSRPEGLGDKDIYIISIPAQKEQALVLIKGAIIPAEGEQLPPGIEIVATNIETGIVTGTYTPMIRDGSFTIIIPPNSNFVLSYQKDGQEFYNEIMEVPADAAYQEINKVLQLKAVSLGGAVGVQLPGQDKTTETIVKDLKTPTVLINGKLLDEKNMPVTNSNVNLLNSKGEIVNTTTTDASGKFTYTNLPEKENYIVALDENDSHTIGKKSFVELRNEKGVLLKTKTTTVKIKPNNKAKIKETAVKEAKATVKNVQLTKVEKKETATAIKHEQLAKVDNLNFQMYFKYNVAETDVNDAPFKEFITNLMNEYNKNGAVSISLFSSASQVPTRAYKSNKELAEARAEKSKEQILSALKDKGADAAKVTFVNTKSLVTGPQYNMDYIINRKTYEKYQFIKISAH